MNIQIPISHSEITNEKFERIIDIYTKEFDSELDRYVSLASVITGLSIDEIEDLDFEQLNDIIFKINQIDILNYESELKEKITIDGVEYGKKSSASFTVKETILLQQIFIKKEIGYLNEILAVIYHPILDGQVKFDYSDKAIAERKDKFKDLTIDIVSPLLKKLTEFLILKNVK